ncbi:MAG TPA: ABC transporter permease [Rheinheimera sp.]|nr:ABC transporter permease [Rheinheimera sp.]
MISFQRFKAVLWARNIEFWRDRTALLWNLLFPILLVVGFAAAFSGDPKAEFKVGVMESSMPIEELTAIEQTKYVEFVRYQDINKAQDKVRHHELDLLLDPMNAEYYVNDSSPKGYLVEKILLQQWPALTKHTVSGQAIRYVDFVVPGIIGMNMMFSCLFGLGYVLVRYRKNSVLKRLQATPLSAFEFLTAQVVSRLLIVLCIASFLFTACYFLVGFVMRGSLGLLLLTAVLGALAMISLALLIVSRVRSEEFAGGMLNLTTWPMMLLSGVWFSLEGAAPAVQQFANLLPLTHLVGAARAIMLDGAGFADVQQHLLVLVSMTVGFLLLATYWFRWQGDGR